MSERAKALILGTSCDPILDLMMQIDEGKIRMKISGLVTSEDSIMICHLANQYKVPIVSKVNARDSSYLNDCCHKLTKQLYERIMSEEEFDLLILCGWKFPIPTVYSKLSIIECEKSSFSEPLLVKPCFSVFSENQICESKMANHLISSMSKWEKIQI